MWDQIDAGIQREMLDEWCAIIAEALRVAPLREGPTREQVEIPHGTLAHPAVHPRGDHTPMTRPRLPYGSVNDIAEATGVHPTTVSRILHGRHAWRRANPKVIGHLFHSYNWRPREPNAKRAVTAWLAAVDREVSHQYQPPVAPLDNTATRRATGPPREYT